MYDTPPQLRADRVEDEVPRGRAPAADDDTIGRQHDDHVGDPDAEITADLGQTGEGPRVAGPGGVRPRPPAVSAPQAGAIWSARA